MTHVYLRHENAAGSTDGVELYPGNSYFLPNESPDTQAVDVVEEMDPTHSMTKLGIYDRDVFVSVYGFAGTEVLEAGGIGRYKIPVSAMDGSNHIFIVLRRDDQILTPSGRWSLVWRTGESQMVVPAQVMNSNGVRTFDSSLEIDDSQSQIEESSMPQDPAGTFVMSMEDTGYDTPALASVLMPPPPLPRVDIVLDTPDEHAREDPASEEDEYESEADELRREETAVTDAAKPLSQGSRAALSELSTNTVIMLRRSGSRSSSAPFLPNGTPLRDENGDFQYPDGATTSLKEIIDDINTRRIPQTGETHEEEGVLPDPIKLGGNANTTESLEAGEGAKKIRFDDSVTTSRDASDLTAVLHTEVMVALHEDPSDIPESTSNSVDARSDHDLESRTSDTVRRSLEEPERATKFEHRAASPQLLIPLQTEKQTMTPRSEISPSFSTSSGKRKATASPQKESFHSKKRKGTSKEQESDQGSEGETITVKVIPKQIRATPTNDSPSYTTRTSKPTTKSLTPLSTSSTKKRSGKKPRSDFIQPTPSRSRSISDTSSSHFEEYLGSPPRVLFASSTTVDSKKNTMKDFKSLGAEVVNDIDQANILVVGVEELKKTAKLIIAVARGMDVVHEGWVIKSRREDVLLDIIPFVPEDNAHETEWDFRLVDAIARGKEGVVQKLLRDITVYTTKDLERFPAARDLPTIVKAMGGNMVKRSLPYGKSDSKNVLILGTRADSQAVEVQQMGHKLYDKDLVILGALRGKIETESLEFQVSVPVKEEESD